MKKLLFVFALLLFSFTFLHAQDEEEVQKGFKKENLFTGGSISLSFFNNTFLIGANPVFGYSIAKWADAGLVVNYNYTSYRDYQQFDDRLRQKVYGGGVFARLYPVKFLFAQAQAEHNFIRLKYLPPNNGDAVTDKTSASSVLVGGGFASGRYPGSGNTYFYMAILFDVSRNQNSPYLDGYGRSIPIIRAGVHIPLFQGGNFRD